LRMVLRLLSAKGARPDPPRRSAGWRRSCRAGFLPRRQPGLDSRQSTGFWFAATQRTPPLTIGEFAIDRRQAAGRSSVKRLPICLARGIDFTRKVAASGSESQPSPGENLDSPPAAALCARRLRRMAAWFSTLTATPRHAHATGDPSLDDLGLLGREIELRGGRPSSAPRRFPRTRHLGALTGQLLMKLRGIARGLSASSRDDHGFGAARGRGRPPGTGRVGLPAADGTGRATSCSRDRGGRPAKKNRFVQGAAHQFAIFPHVGLQIRCAERSPSRRRAERRGCRNWAPIQAGRPVSPHRPPVSPANPAPADDASRLAAPPSRGRGPEAALRECCR